MSFAISNQAACTKIPVPYAGIAPDQVRRVGACTSQPQRAPRRIDVNAAAQMRGEQASFALGVAKFTDRWQAAKIFDPIVAFYLGNNPPVFAAL